MAQPPNNSRPLAGSYGFNWSEGANSIPVEQVDLQEEVNKAYERDSEKIMKDADEAFKREYQKRMFRNAQRGWVNTPPLPKAAPMPAPKQSSVSSSEWAENDERSIIDRTQGKNP